MKWPTMDEFAKNVAEKALDEYEYKGKTLRQWVEIIYATDTNVATKVGTNLAEVGTDAISRKALINKFEQWKKQDGYDNEAWNLLVDVITEIKNMPLATDIYVGTNDAISRQQAIDAVRMVIGDNRSISVCDAIKQLPPIQPKRGKWTRTGSGSLYDHYECSECGKAPKWECMGDNRWKIAFTDFCPNCGADMRGEP